MTILGLAESFKAMIGPGSVVGHNVDRKIADQTVCQQTKCRIICLWTPDISQLRIYRPPLSFAPVLMKDAQCAESKEKSIFPIFIFRGILKIHGELGCFEYKNDHKQKKK